MIKRNNSKSNAWLLPLLLTTIALTVLTAMNNESSESGNEVELVDSTISESRKVSKSREIDINSSTNESLISDNQLIPWDKLNRNQNNLQVSKDLFKPHSWVVIPPAPKVKPTPPPPPVAPPSPFIYFGKMEDGPKGTLLFLIANNKVYSAKKGEKIDAFWRYDSDDANNIYMTYLPLNLPQVLSKSQKASTQLQANIPAGLNYEGN